MIVDLVIGGVLIPGLLVVAIMALIGTVAMLRLLASVGAARLFVHRPLVELATFAILYGLLVQFAPPSGYLQ